MTASDPGRPTLCWVVSDGRRGIENQALGLAEAVARRLPLVIERQTAPPAPRGLKALAAALAGRRAQPGEALAAADLQPPWPQLWIACGRATLGLSTAAARLAAPRPYVVQVQDPKTDPAAFDLVIPPEHDAMAAHPAVFPILGSPNRITPDGLEAARAAFAETLARLPGPRAAVLIGGDSKRHRLTRPDAETLADRLAAVRAEGASLLITTSRRTPVGAVEALRARFADQDRVWLWTGEADGPNPYLAYLAAADVVIATRDSTNMLTEAAAAGRPVLIAAMTGRDAKFASLYARLEAMDLARPFQGRLETWETTPLAETERAAGEVVRRFARHCAEIRAAARA